MLALSFFTVVFSSLLWVIYAIVQVADKLSDGSLNNAGIVDISIYVAFVLLPVFALWVIFGIISQYLHNQNFNRNLFYLLSQMKKNQDYSDLLARIMLEGEQQIKDGFAIQQFDLFISDMNELISEIIQRSSLASPEQIDRLWSKVQNGGRWAFGKVLIEVNQNQPNFQMRIFEKSQRDNVIAGTILEWCARYLSLTALLEKHDKERVFIAIIETGVFGKVFSILAPVSDEIRRSREFAPSGPVAPVFAPKEAPAPAPAQANVAYEEENSGAPQPQPQIEPREPEKNTIFEKIDAKALAAKAAKFNPFRKEKSSNYFMEQAPSSSEDRDPFSIALERSFGETEELAAPKIAEPSFDKEDDFSVAEEMSAPVNEPRFEPQVNDMPTEEPPAPKIEPKETAIQPEEDERFSNTRKTLNDLKKEWEEMRNATSSAASEKEPEAPSFEKPQPEPKEEEKEENYAYPFGSWTNEANYHK